MIPVERTKYNKSSSRRDEIFFHWLNKNSKSNYHVPPGRQPRGCQSFYQHSVPPGRYNTIVNRFDVPKLGIYYYLCNCNYSNMERIFAKSTLREYWEKHPDSEQYLKTWYDTAMNSEWRTPADVKKYT